MIPVLNIINGCVLFPHMPDWGSAPTNRRVWETNIAEAINGAESRSAMRSVPRRDISFLVTAQSLGERSRLEARMDAALESGFGCAPLHGRSSTLMNAANAGSRVNILLNLGGGWNWKAGDYAMLLQDDLTYDIAAVVNVGLTADGNWTADSPLPIDQPTLTLAAPLNWSWNAGMQVRPIVFGKFSCAKQEALNGNLGAVKLTISELTSARSTQIGQLAAQPPGIGQQVIGKTNIVT
jgi:hypothetical protein